MPACRTSGCGILTGPHPPACTVPVGDARPFAKGSIGKQFGGLLNLISQSELVASWSARLQEVVLLVSQASLYWTARVSHDQEMGRLFLSGPGCECFAEGYT